MISKEFRRLSTHIKSERKSKVNTVYVIAQNKDHIVQLMKPFNIDLVVPNVVDMHDFIMKEKEHFMAQLKATHNNGDTRDPLKMTQENLPYDTQNVETLYKIADTQNKESDVLFWEKLTQEYGISKDDMLPNEQFIRRFNPNGKWDYYDIEKETRPVKHIRTEDITANTHYLLPNYLWMSAYDQQYNANECYTRIKTYADYTMYTVNFHN